MNILVRKIQTVTKWSQAPKWYIMAKGTQRVQHGQRYQQQKISLDEMAMFTECALRPIQALGCDFCLFFLVLCLLKQATLCRLN